MLNWRLSLSIEAPARTAICLASRALGCALVVVALVFAVDSSAMAHGQERSELIFAPYAGTNILFNQLWREKFNAVRQKSMISDVEKLLKLTSELNADIASAGEAPLSRGELKKVTEIEKLARQVKGSMELSPTPGW